MNKIRVFSAIFISIFIFRINGFAETSKSNYLDFSSVPKEFRYIKDSKDILQGTGLMVNGKTYLPIRDVSNLFNINIKYENGFIIFEDLNKKIKADNHGYLKNNRYYVSIRNLSKILDIDINYEENKIKMIKNNEEFIIQERFLLSNQIIDSDKQKIEKMIFNEHKTLFLYDPSIVIGPYNYQVASFHKVLNTLMDIEFTGTLESDIMESNLIKYGFNFGNIYSSYDNQVAMIGESLVLDKNNNYNFDKIDRLKNINKDILESELREYINNLTISYKDHEFANHCYQKQLEDLDFILELTQDKQFRSTIFYVFLEESLKENPNDYEVVVSSLKRKIVDFVDLQETIKLNDNFNK